MAELDRPAGGGPQASPLTRGAELDRPRRYARAFGGGPQACLAVGLTRGAELLLVGPVPPPTGGVASHVAALARALGSDVAQVADPGRGKLALAARLAGARTAHVHVCGHNRPSFALLALAALIRPRPIVTLHSGLCPAWLAARSTTERLAIRRLLGGCAAVVCVSDAIGAAVRALRVDEARVHVVSPFVAEGLTPGALPPELAALRRAAPRLIAAAVAPGAEYGVDVLREAFARVAAIDPGAHLVTFGPGPGAHGPRVHHAGELAHDAALALLAAADVFVRPTRADGDAISVREARALGTRVVATDVARRPAGTTLCAAGDPAGLARAVQEALASPPPAADEEGGFPELARLYARLGIARRKEDQACAASQAV